MELIDNLRHSSILGFLLYVGLYGGRGMILFFTKNNLFHLLQVIHMVSHWVQLWALLSPEEERDAITSGCTRLQMVAHDILCQADWRHNRRLC
jgi:hypothetical protein